MQKELERATERLRGEQTERERLAAELARTAQQRDELERSVAGLVEERDALGAQLRAERAQVEEREAAARARLAALEEELRAAVAAQQEAGPSVDDLTRLKGVGPKFAEALAAAGITRFAQVAAWQDEDIERVAAELRTRASRIRKDGWVEQARALSTELSSER